MWKILRQKFLEFIVVTKAKVAKGIVLRNKTEPDEGETPCPESTMEAG